MGNLNRSKGVNGTPSKAYTNSIPDQHSIYPGGQHTLAFFIKNVLIPVGPLWTYALEAIDSTRAGASASLHSAVIH